MKQLSSFLTFTPAGFYCEQGDFYIDPTRSVKKAIITHGHSDHARRGVRHYLANTSCEYILRERLGDRINLETVPYGETISLNGVRVSLHPAGHILGSAQTRLEYQGEICVVSGDYALTPNSTCAPFEPITCHTFITEVTFGLPIYKWSRPEDIFRAINTWWGQNAQTNTTSLIFAYSLGKAQRIIAGVDSSIGPILTHETVDRMNHCYRQSGVSLPETSPVQSITDKAIFTRALVITPSAANLSIPHDLRISTAFASGWMQIRKNRKNSNVDRAFVLSDHADWEGLLRAIEYSEAETIWATHGSAAALTRWLREQGKDARVI